MISLCCYRGKVWDFRTYTVETAFRKSCLRANHGTKHQEDSYRLHVGKSYSTVLLWYKLCGNFVEEECLAARSMHYMTDLITTCAYRPVSCPTTSRLPPFPHSDRHVHISSADSAGNVNASRCSGLVLNGRPSTYSPTPSSGA